MLFFFLVFFIFCVNFLLIRSANTAKLGFLWWTCCIHLIFWRRWTLSVHHQFRVWRYIAWLLGLLFNYSCGRRLCLNLSWQLIWRYFQRISHIWYWCLFSPKIVWRLVTWFSAQILTLSRPFLSLLLQVWFHGLWRDLKRQVDTEKLILLLELMWMIWIRCEFRHQCVKARLAYYFFPILKSDLSLLFWWRRNLARRQLGHWLWYLSFLISQIRCINVILWCRAWCLYLSENLVVRFLTASITWNAWRLCNNSLTPRNFWFYVYIINAMSS